MDAVADGVLARRADRRPGAAGGGVGRPRGHRQGGGARPPTATPPGGPLDDALAGDRPPRVDELHRRAAPDARPTSSTTRRRDADHGSSRRARYRHPIDPPAPAPPGIPSRARHQEATLVTVVSRRRSTGTRQRRRPARPASCWSACWAASTRSAPRSVRELCETVDFHGGRPWTVEVACWDLVGRALDEPVWRLLGGRRDRIAAYASAAHLVGAATSGRGARWRLRDAGVGAIKLRFGLGDWRGDVDAVVAGARGGRRRGWRSWSTPTRAGGCRATCGPRWDVANARAVRASARAAAHPLAGGAAGDGRRRRLRRAGRVAPTCALAAGEMVRQAHEARDLIVRGGVDVIQSDVVLGGGIGGCRRIVGAGASCTGRAWSPHTWSNGYGLVANLHAAWRFSDHGLRGGAVRPPGVEGRAAATGCCPRRSRSPPTARSPRRPGPGLGVEPDLDALEQWRVA